MSAASESATRFLPTDINQLSRVTNECRLEESVRSRRTAHHTYVKTMSDQTCFTIRCIYASVVRSNVRPRVKKTTVLKANPRDFTKDARNVKSRRRRVRREFHGVRDLYLFENTASGSIMHNHVARIINEGGADRTRDTRVAIINRE